MSRAVAIAFLAIVGPLAAAELRAQARPYIGYAYPAGGQQGTTFQVRLGGQNVDDVDQVLVTGKGVTGKVVDCLRRLNPQESTLMREQLNELKPRQRGGRDAANAPPLDPVKQKMIARIEKRLGEYCNRPACAALATIIILELTIAPDAEPGPRELRLAAPRGVSNALPFHVGQAPEVSRKPMRIAEFQVLGKEELAQRKRPEDEVEQRITVPCTMNGQVASGEVNRYRFDARKGQRLVISTAARQLIPYVADAVPGWFQPVLALYDDKGKEIAFNDDFRFRPDPMILFDVPKDGEYVLDITDAIYRGREDFVYRLTIGELPMVTGIFPLGGRVGETPKIEMQGWNLKGAELTPLPKDAAAGVHFRAANKAGMVSNRVPFALDTLPEVFDKEGNNDPQHAQKVTLPVIVNGRVDRPDDWDVFEVAGRGGETLVAEVSARRLDSPLDSMLKVTDASGKLLALNDDREDAAAGTNTHHADSYLSVKLPADGKYYVHLGDTARCGGEEYAYRLRIGAPQPDFALRVVPSSIAIRGRSTGSLTVYAIRRDGFNAPIKLGLKDPPKGISATPVSISPTQDMMRITVKADAQESGGAFRLSVVGTAQVGDREIVHEAVGAEDRMQAFLWRHLVPAEELKALVYSPSYEPPPKRVPRARPAPTDTKPATPPDPSKFKFTKQQVAGRLRQLKVLFEDWLLTDEFYERKVAECEAVR